MGVETLSRAMPPGVIYALAPFAIVAFALSLVRLYTGWQYYKALQHWTNVPTKPGKKTLDPPQIPYTLPWLGNTFSFLNTRPGEQWNELFSWHPRSTGACTLLLGGKKTHILYSPYAVQAMFKDRTLKRDAFERELFGKVFVMSEQQIQNAENGKHFEVEMNSQYLTKHDRVNELTTHFTRVLDDVLGRDAEDIVNKESVGLYDWLRDRMFTASTTALMGDKILEMYPEFCEDFFKFDYEFLSYFFDLPSFMMRDAIKRRERIFSKLQEWSKLMHEKCGGSPVDPEGPAWEPYMGSRLNRARQLDYKNRKLNERSSAALNLGITFGLSSNVIPATGWMLMNVLNPRGDRTLLPRVMAELRKAEKDDGTIDIPLLIASPLLQSLWTETLRLYTDVLVTRNAGEDTTLPLDEDGKTFITLKKDEHVFAPCWLGHHDSNAWSSDKAPLDEFYAERFLVDDPSNPEQQVFTVRDTTGKFFPFGGGKTVCPGRVFAKQEGLGAFAMVLLRFEFDVLGFVDMEKKATDEFPGFAKSFPGSGALAPGGDLRVKVRKREMLN